MKKLILASLLLFLINCNKEQKYSPEIEAEAQRRYDSVLASLKEKSFEDEQSDSTGMKTSPVMVIDSRIVERDYSNYRDIELRYKNVSDKTVTGIRFEWYGKNAFGEPADMGGLVIEGSGGGFTDETIKSGKKSYGRWSIMSRDVKTITMARAYEVAFSDGTKWKLRK